MSYAGDDMSTGYQTIYNDLRESLMLARKNITSYFLGILGLLLVSAIVISVSALVVLGITYISVGGDFNTWIYGLQQMAVLNPDVLVLGGFGIAVLLIASLFMTLIGPLFGMSYEVAATGSTRAEAVFSWLRSRFVKYFICGSLMALIVAGVPILLWYINALFYNYSIPPLVESGLSVFTSVWVFVTIALTSMVMPAITRGSAVIEAFRVSLRLATKRFERIFGLWCAILLLLLVTFGPSIVWTTVMGPMIPSQFLLTSSIVFGSLIIAVFTVVVAFAWWLLLFPMVLIALCRVYSELTTELGGQKSTDSVGMHSRSAI